MPLPVNKVSLRYWPRQTVRRLRAWFKRRCLRQLNAIAVTGSCGKTSAATYLNRILSLSSQGKTHAGIINNELNGIMRSMRHLRSEHRYYVQEVSGHEPGHLRLSLPLVKHQVGIVTTVGLDHYTTFRTREAVAEEKGWMVEMLPKSGVAVLNADDPHVAAMASRTRARVITYGLSAGTDVQATDVSSVWPDRLTFTVSCQGESKRIETQLFGDILLPSVLASISGALALGVPLAACAEALQGVEPVFGRLSVHRISNGVWFVFDFKGVHWTFDKVFELVRQARAPRITMVFGSVSDTSGDSSKRYRQIAKRALSMADRVIWVGDRSSHVTKLITAENQDRLFTFDQVEEAAAFLKMNPVEDELVIIKSANAQHLERLIWAQDNELLCWKNKCPLVIHCQNCPRSGLVEQAS